MNNFWLPITILSTHLSGKYQRARAPGQHKADFQWSHFQGHYHRFSTEYGFKHVTSSPNCPKSNGFIERQVKIVKRVLKKAQRSNSDPNPIDNKLPSPAELLLGWRIQDNLPRKITSNHTSDEVIHKLQERQVSQKFYYDQYTHVLPSLTPGEQVSQGH